MCPRNQHLVTPEAIENNHPSAEFRELKNRQYWSIQSSWLLSEVGNFDVDLILNRLLTTTVRIDRFVHPGGQRARVRTTYDERPRASLGNSYRITVKREREYRVNHVFNPTFPCGSEIQEIPRLRRGFLSLLRFVRNVPNVNFYSHLLSKLAVILGFHASVGKRMWSFRSVSMTASFLLAISGVVVFVLILIRM